MIPEWYFGPAGDLRPLPPPSPGVGNAVERFGGTHRGINGGRVVDTFGFKASYSFNLEWLTPDEYFRLESLFTQLIPGPYHLIDPLRKNLFSRQASAGRNAISTDYGFIWSNTSVIDWVRVPDSPVSWINRAAEWTSLEDAENYVRLDNRHHIPVRTGEDTTLSVYLKPSSTVDVYLSVDTMYDTQQVGTADDTPVTLTAGEWTRLEYTFSFDATVDAVRPVLWTGPMASTNDTLTILIPQIEYGSTATDPALGGASIKGAIESLAPTSPRYPLQSVDMTVLEV